MTATAREPDETVGATARVRLAHYTPTVAELWVAKRSRWTRTLRATLVAIALPPAALVAFLIPPHGETLFLAVAGGIYLIYREATTQYVVGGFSGTCPRCTSPLTLKSGSRLTAARSVPCYGCHFHPTIELASASTPAGDTALPLDVPSVTSRSLDRFQGQSRLGG